MLGVRREQGGRSPGKRSRDGPLQPRIDLQRGQCEPLALRRERPRGGRDSFARAERPLERGEPLARRVGAFGEVVPLARRSPCRSAGLVRASLELRRCRGTAACMRPSGLVLVADAAGEVGGALAARAKPLAGRAERHERTVGRAVAARQLAEALIDALTLTAHVLELPLGLVGDRALGRREERVRVARALGRVTASRRRVTRGRPRRAGRLLERPDGLVGAGLPGLLGLREVVLQPPGERTRRLAAKRETLARPLEPVQRTDRRLARAGGVGELDLGALTLGENGLEPLLRRPPGKRGRGATLLRLRPASLEGLEVEPGDARAQRCDLEPQLLRALGSGRLERQRPEPLAHLLLDVPRPLGLSGDPGELELRPVTTALELSEAGRLLDEGAAVGRLRREHGVDLSLADDRVHRAAEPDVGEQLDEVGAAHGGAVDEVLPLAAAHEPSRDGDLAEVELVCRSRRPRCRTRARPRSGRRTGGSRSLRRGRRRASRRASRTASASRPPRRLHRRRSTCRSRSGRPRRPPRARGSPRWDPGTT